MGQSRNTWVSHVIRGLVTQYVGQSRIKLAGPKVTYYVTFATYYVTCKITDDNRMEMIRENCQEKVRWSGVIERHIVLTWRC